MRPDQWAVKGTSVQVANALQQAAEMQTSNPNYAWASQAARPVVPRSTSVEYENQSQQATQRRLGAPPSKGSVPPRAGQHNGTRRPLERGETTLVVPDSEEENRPRSFVRGKSPFEAIVDTAASALGGAQSFLLKRRDTNRSLNGSATTLPAASNTNDPSYDYSEEERAYQASQVGKDAAQARKAQSGRKAGRMSMDNKAYKPTDSDLEESDEDYSDDDSGRRRRKKAKKKTDSTGGPLMSLPVVGYAKKKKGKKGKAGGLIDDEETGSDDQEVSESFGALFPACLICVSPASSDHARYALGCALTGYIRDLDTAYAATNIPDGITAIRPTCTTRTARQSRGLLRG
jgi:SUN domain-containing protein 1/2